MSLVVILAGQIPRTLLAFLGILSLPHLSFVSDRIKFFPVLAVGGEDVTRELVDIVLTERTTILPSLPPTLSSHKYLRIYIEIPPLSLGIRIRVTFIIFLFLFLGVVFMVIASRLIREVIFMIINEIF